MSDPQIITKSRLGTFNKCQRLHDLTYNRGYRSILPREYADFGTMLHAALDAWWRAHGRGEQLTALSDALQAMHDSGAGLTGVDAFARAKGEILMTAYDARWAPTMHLWDVVGVEVEFVATIPGRKLLRIAGKIDKVLRRRETGRMWFAEHKTTGADLSLGSTYWQRLRVDPQVSIYYDGMGAIGHDDVEGCLYDVLVRPDQRQLKATPVELRKYTQPTKKEPVSRLYKNQREDDEMIHEFAERVAAAVATNPDAYLARSEVVRTRDEIEAARADIEATALQIRAAAHGGASPRNPDACFLYNRPCDFLGPCSGTESLDDETKFVRLDDPHPELGGGV